MRPASALPPVFGLMLGLPCVLGCAIGNLITDIISGYGLAICVLGFAAQFVYDALPFFIWKEIKRKNKYEPVFFRLNNVKNVLRYISIILINAAVMAAILGGIMKILNISLFFSTATLIMNRLDSH